MAALLQRFGSALVAITGVAVLVFLLTHVIPGDPVEVLLGELASPGDRAAMATALGLDQPLYRQFTQYFAGLLRGDLGESLFYRRGVADLLLERAAPTLQLAAAGLLCALLIALPLGLVAALRPNSPWDRLSMGLSLAGVSIPNFWLGPLLMLLFALQLGWLPVSGRESAAALVLPAVTLGSGLAAVLARMLRTSLLEVLGQDYVRTARAKGLSPGRVVMRHALANALLPLITVLGLQLGVVLGGVVIVETVFSWPGLGSLTVEAIQRRDYPLVQGCVLLIAASYVLVNSATDWLYTRIDPRVRILDR
ncbi:MAG: nickel ABC transporter permease [Pseudomonadota bacterium]|nr:nickel ABC transporter permease [Pseudomonadota bacterium]